MENVENELEKELKEKELLYANQLDEVRLKLEKNKTLFKSYINEQNVIESNSFQLMPK